MRGQSRSVGLGSEPNAATSYSAATSPSSSYFSLHFFSSFTETLRGRPILLLVVAQLLLMPQYESSSLEVRLPYILRLAFFFPFLENQERAGDRPTARQTVRLGGSQRREELKRSQSSNGLQTRKAPIICSDPSKKIRRRRRQGIRRGRKLFFLFWNFHSKQISKPASSSSSSPSSLYPSVLHDRPRRRRLSFDRLVVGSFVLSSFHPSFLPFVLRPLEFATSGFSAMPFTAAVFERSARRCLVKIEGGWLAG